MTEQNLKTQPLRCAIFCRVIDNFGDIGVCWRLARQLSNEYGWHVTLWVDDLNAFKILAPQLDTSLSVQQLNAIEVVHWQNEQQVVKDFIVNQVADVVIEGFGCRIPTAYLKQMAQTTPAPIWINLEYLSAETWVNDFHGLPSVHPQTGLTQTFWFTSPLATAGGLIRENNALNQPIKTPEWITQYHPQSLSISLFSYKNTAINNLLNSLRHYQQPSTVFVLGNLALEQVNEWLVNQNNIEDLAQNLITNQTLTINQLQLIVLPFLSHTQYDELLQFCTANFVRGEDSWVRAQWANKPWVWHTYPQEEDAHLIKLEAMLDLIKLQTDQTQANQHLLPNSFFEAQKQWNTPSVNTEFWLKWLEELAVIAHGLRGWQNYLQTQPDLAARLVRFCDKNRVEYAPKLH